MLNELIDKIAMQTGLPAATVTPVIGAVLSHLSDILPPPIAHMLAISLGIHEEPAGPAPGSMMPGEAPISVPAGGPMGGQEAGGLGGLGGLLGGLGGGGAGQQSLEGMLGSLLGGGAAHGQQGGFAGAGALASVAEALLGSLLAGRR